MRTITFSSIQDFSINVVAKDPFAKDRNSLENIERLHIDFYASAEILHNPRAYKLLVQMLETGDVEITMRKK